VTVHFQHVKWLLPFPDSRTRETVQLSRIIIDQEGDFQSIVWSKYRKSKLANTKRMFAPA
jgi:pyruvate/2-oxoacid:ferredoxin oxidoreductase alpha subunit